MQHHVVSHSNVHNDETGIKNFVNSMLTISYDNSNPLNVEHTNVVDWILDHIQFQDQEQEARVRFTPKKLFHAKMRDTKATRHFYVVFLFPESETDRVSRLDLNSILLGTTGFNYFTSRKKSWDEDEVLQIRKKC